MADCSSEAQLPFWHCFTDPDGNSRQARRTLKGFERQSMGGDAGEQWNLPFDAPVKTILFAELPVGFDGDWHENPEVQWIVPLSGSWWVETMDGQRVEMGPGEISLGHDQGTKGGKGHRSGVVGDAPCRMMIVQLGALPDDVAAQLG